MSAANNKVLVKMLDRLFAALVNGPSLNARPHASRQRVDLAQLNRLGDVSAEEAFKRLLGEARQVRVAARVPQPKRRGSPAAFGKRRFGKSAAAGDPGNGAAGDAPDSNGNGEGKSGPKFTDAERAAERAWADQQALLAKLRVIADDARTYEQDTGVHVLNVGFPLLSLPPGSFDARQAGSTRRILAPVAFIPVAVTLAGGATQTIQLACRGDGIDRVTPNNALLAWLEQQTGKPAAPELFMDQSGADPWREVCDLVAHVCTTLDLDVPELFKPPAPGATAPPSAIEVGTDVGSASADRLPLDDDPGGAVPEVVIPATTTTNRNNRSAEADPTEPENTDPDLGAVPLDSEDIEEELTPPPLLARKDAKPQAAVAAPVVPKTGIDALKLVAPPRSDEDDDDQKPRVVPSAVIGLFPMANQGLLRDMQAMVAGEALAGPVKSFIDVGASFFDKPPAADDADAVAPVERTSASSVEPRTRAFGDERLVTGADPFQSRAVRLARQSTGLVVHGPPGTGKSQTITNIIGDHLSRGQRVLLVCDKRTALDVVYNRLEHMGLGPLCALIHDPQRDQRELYKAVREQLDALPEAKIDAKATVKLAKADAELQRLHAELSGYCASLMRPAKDAGHGLSLHELMGQWLALAPVEVVMDRPHDSLSPVLGGEGRGEGLFRMKSTTHSVNEAVQYGPSPQPSPLSTGEREKYRGAANVSGTQPPTRGERGQVALPADAVSAIPLTVLDEHEATLRDILSRAGAVDFAQNPWARAAGTTLADFLARPMEPVRGAMNDAVGSARDADATADPAIPPFAAGVDLVRVGKARADLAERLDVVTGRVDAAVRARWAAAVVSDAGAEAIRRARQRMLESDSFVQAMRAAPLDAELALTVRDNMPTLSPIAQQLASLAQYLEIAPKWWSFLAFAKKKQAAAVLNRYGLTLQPSSAERVRTFLTGLRARLALRDLVAELGGANRAPNDAPAVPPGTPGSRFAVSQAGAPSDPPERQRSPLRNREATPEVPGGTAVPTPTVYGAASTANAIPDDAVTLRALQQHAAVIDLLTHTGEDPAIRELLPSVVRALTDAPFAGTFLDGLRKSPARAEALAKLEETLSEARLFDPGWLAAVSKKLRAGHAGAAFLSALADRVDTLEGVLRVREGLAAVPASLRPAADSLLKQSADADEGLTVLRREVLAAEITRCLRAEPHLQSADGQRLSQMFDQYRELDAKKKEFVRDAVLHQWVDKQRSRLLAPTGSRLNSLGADLRRRLTTRGERAMRLRQVVAIGRGVEGGDPLFDLRPIWMASPETVAQVFPREPIFDVVVFDEASQCRLEEALPVLVRGRRVTIAGDPKQLPPTRFFESAVAASDDDADLDTDQQLFEMQQGETEDLLGAALGLDIQQCYLDVHYRSRSAELIAFSNEHFYGSRLQPIPGHPSRRPALPPVRLVRVEGVYDKGENEAEADRVVKLVHELLSKKDPPSIGVACFNLQQRDLIVEKLDELAAVDAPFAKKLAEARARRGAGSFDGLFVKNLENVQGDERDHIIISTTYGPDAKGKFYRRFGPLGRAGGGRRLNVLVTRAREQVHVVTSIPPEAYRSLPEVPAGTTPGGGWLLFAYLKYAEELGREYDEPENAVSSARPEDAQPQAAVVVRPTRHPSPFATALAGKLHAARGLGADVHWGNEGFCIDVALRGAADGETTVGVLCDAARFAESEDPMEWDAFRTAVLEKQGWRLHRVWTPHFFRDPKGAVKQIAAVAEGGGAPRAGESTSSRRAAP